MIKNHEVDWQIQTKWGPVRGHEHYVLQTDSFVWLSWYKKILSAMAKAHHHFYLHHMVSEGRWPVQPRISCNVTYCILPFTDKELLTLVGVHYVSVYYNPTVNSEKVSVKNFWDINYIHNSNCSDWTTASLVQNTHQNNVSHHFGYAVNIWFERYAYFLHTSSTLVSSPDPTLSRGETVWWSKLNFLG